jgi:hypothetical protein
VQIFTGTYYADAIIPLVGSGEDFHWRILRVADIFASAQVCPACGNDSLGDGYSVYFFSALGSLCFNLWSESEDGCFSAFYLQAATSRARGSLSSACE